MFDDIAKDLEAAAVTTIRTAARSLSGVATSQINRNFKSKNSRFSVKTYDLKQSSVVQIKPSFIGAFAEGKTIRGKSTLIILLPDGERLGFKRISSSNTWASVWQKIKNRSKLASVGDGLVVVYNYRGKNYAIYKFQRQVTAPRLISLAASSESLLSEIPDSIDKLMDAKNE